jgi:alkaline phosphatase
MNNKFLLLLTATAIATIPAYSQAKNVILFIGDGAGISSLNAASISGYGLPQALYIQKMQHLALADTSTAKEWVTDAAASASAWATGKKGRNGVMSMSPDAEKDIRDGEIYKTVMEYAMEQDLSTGIISNDGVAGAAVSAFYAHHNNRGKAGEIFQQALNAKFGKGPNVIIGSGRKQITDQTTALGHNLAADIKARGYAYLDSMASLAEFDKNNDRVIALFDDNQFNFNTAVQQAVARLSKNPKGFLLIAHSDCHTGKTRTSLQRLIDFDKAVAATGEQMKSDTLILFTADHSYDLRIKGEALTETSKASDHSAITMAGAQGDQALAVPSTPVALRLGTLHLWGFQYAMLDTGKISSSNGTAIAGAIGYSLVRDLSLTVNYRAGLVKLGTLGRE